MRACVFISSVSWGRWVPAADFGIQYSDVRAELTVTTVIPKTDSSSRSVATRTEGTQIPLQSTTQQTSPKYVLRQPYVLELQPFVEIGIQAVRPGPPRVPPPNHVTVCPSDRAYCVDFRASDNGTCMYPDPLEIKRCYDSSCINSPWNALVFRTQGENSYCKDFMTPAGRVCQWADNQACTCNTKSIMYYDAEFIPPGENIPPGFSQVYPCTYPLDVIRRAAEEAARKARDRKRNRDQRRRKGKRTSDDEHSDDDDSEDRPRGMHQRDDDDESANGASFLSTGKALCFVTLSLLIITSF